LNTKPFFILINLFLCNFRPQFSNHQLL
jgi:hypothetical protein